MRLFIRKECSDPANCALPGPANVTEKNELIVVHGKDEGGDIFYYPHPEDDLLLLGIQPLSYAFDPNEMPIFLAAEGETTSLTCVAERFRPLPFIR